MELDFGNGNSSVLCLEYWNLSGEIEDLTEQVRTNLRAGDFEVPEEEIVVVLGSVRSYQLSMGPSPASAWNPFTTIVTCPGRGESHPAHEVQVTGKFRG